MMFRFACLSGAAEQKEPQQTRCNIDIKPKKKKNKKNKKNKDKNKRKSKSKKSGSRFSRIRSKSICSKQIANKHNTSKNIDKYQIKHLEPPIKIDINNEMNTNPLNPEIITIERIKSSRTQLIPTGINTDLEVVLSGDDMPPIQIEEESNNRNNTLDAPSFHRKQNSKIITRNRNKRKKEQNKNKKKKKESKCSTPSYKVDLDDSSGYLGPQRYTESPLPAPPPRKPSLSSKPSLSNTLSNVSNYSNRSNVVTPNGYHIFSPSEMRANIYVFPSSTTGLFVET